MECMSRGLPAIIFECGGQIYMLSMSRTLL
ncbi:hypothetical protein [Klebsiella pneumoniae]